VIRTALSKASWVSGQVIGISSQNYFTFCAQKIRMGIFETSTMPRQGVAMGQWASLPFHVSDAVALKLATGNGILEAFQWSIGAGRTRLLSFSISFSFIRTLSFFLSRI